MIFQDGQDLQRRREVCIESVFIRFICVLCGECLLSPFVLFFVSLV